MAFILRTAFLGSSATTAFIAFIFIAMAKKRKYLRQHKFFRHNSAAKKSHHCSFIFVDQAHRQTEQLTYGQCPRKHVIPVGTKVSLQCLIRLQRAHFRSTCGDWRPQVKRTRALTFVRPRSTDRITSQVCPAS